MGKTDEVMNTEIVKDAPHIKVILENQSFILGAVSFLLASLDATDVINTHENDVSDKILQAAATQRRKQQAEREAVDELKREAETTKQRARELKKRKKSKKTPKKRNTAGGGNKSKGK